MTKPASAAASSEPGSEICSFVDSEDDLSEKLVTSTSGPLIEDIVVQNSIGVTTNMADTVLPSTLTALPLSGAALPLTQGTIQSIVVPLSVQDTPCVAGSSGMPLISMPQVTQVAGPLINMRHAAIQPAAMQPVAMQPAALQPEAMQPAAMQPTAMPLFATPSIMSVRPYQMGYLTGAPSALLIHRALNSLTCQTPVGRFLRWSKCCKISFFKSHNSLRLGELAMLSLRCRLPNCFIGAYCL